MALRSPPRLLAALAVACAAAQQPFQLLCDDREDPVVGVESRAPVFSWAVTQASQAAFQLQVMTSATPASSLVWDSGTVTSPYQNVTYGGAALNASTRYVWQVRVSADGSAWTPFASASFVTGVWGPWVASSIWHANASAAFTFFRAELAVPASQPIAYALAFATANPQGITQGEQENAKLLAAYRLYLQGALVGMGPGRPGTCGPVCPVGGDPGVCTCSPMHVYDAYDITEMVQGAVGGCGGGSSCNLTLSIQAYNIPPKAGSSVMNATSQVLVQVVLVYVDGSRAVVGTSSSSSSGGAGTGASAWSAYNADVYYSPSCCTSDLSWYYQPAENCDARVEPVGWRLPGYIPSPSAGWTAAVQPAWPQAAPLVARPTRPLVITQGIQPASIVTLGPGHFFLDFGREFQGGLRLDIANGTAGMTLQVRLGEELLSVSPPAVMYNMRTGNKYVHTYTLRDGPQTFEHHEYMEFRYVELLYDPTPTPQQCVRTVAADYTTPVTLSCADPKGTIGRVTFASWGTPSGSCTTGGDPWANTFAVNGSCAYDGTAGVLAGLCVGKPSCTFTPSDSLFGGRDPCDKVEKYLAAAVMCTGAGEGTEAVSGGGSGNSGVGGVADSPTPTPPNVTAWVLTYPARFAAMPSSTSSAAGAAAPAPSTLPARFAAAPRQVTTSSPSLNAVWDMCQYTVVATALDMYTDSNTRQRSVICAEALHINLLMQYATSTERAMQRYTLEYTINTRPSNLGWAEWQALTIFSVHAVYLHTGDLSLFASYYDHLKDFTELALLNATTGLWTCEGNDFACNKPEIDWPSNMRDGFVFMPADTVVNAYTYRAMLLFATMAADLGGHEGDVTLFTQAAAGLRDAMNAQLYNESCGCYVDGLGTTHTSWHSSVYALAFGVPTASQVPAVLSYVANRSVGQPDLCQPGNVYPAQWALEGLYTYGLDWGSTGLALLTCNGTNGWIEMLRQNATTTSEAWNAEEKPNETWSHSWAASPADIIPRFVLGVRPLAPGFKRLLVQPQLGTLTWAEGVVPTAMGPVAVAANQTLQQGGAGGAGAGGGQGWETYSPVPAATPTTITVAFTVPGHTQARVCLPAPPCSTGGGGGAPSITLDGQQVQAEVEGVFACVEPVLAGQHVAACGTGVSGER